MNNVIYLRLQGRIGNQLFMYAFARNIQEQLGADTKIVIDERLVLRQNWINSLKDYSLHNVEYVSEYHSIHKFTSLRQRICIKFYEQFYLSSKNYTKKFAFEKRFQEFFNANGLIICENGYLPYKVSKGKNIILLGFFQSEKYFVECADKIKQELDLSKKLEKRQYPNLDEIISRNSICISIKVEHNIGSKLYDVCSKEYWKNAIDYIIDRVENPLFFICSDNVEYVLSNLIDCQKYDVITQEKNYDVSLSLAAMSKCKHFIIGNTTYGWWAQYLSNNESKIVIAPRRWMLVDMPIDIYQDNWVLL